MASRHRTRREFVRDAALLGAGVTLPLPLALPGVPPRGRAPGGRVRKTLRVGVVVPGAGPAADLGASASRGASLGMAEANHVAEALGRRFELVEATIAEAAGAPEEARRLVEREGVFAVVGGLEEGSCPDLGEAVTGSGALFLNAGCATDALRSRCRPLVFHVEASFAMYADAVAAWATAEEGPRRWHFVSGESKTADAALRRARSALLGRGGEDAGTTRLAEGADPGPALVAARGSGADLVFLCLGGNAREAFLTRYASEEPAPFEVAGAPGGTARLRAAPPASRAGVWPTLWHHKLFRYGAEQLDDRFRGRFGHPLDDRAWAGWMAVKAVVEAVLRADTAEPGELARHLESRTAQFDGHKGRRLAFRPWDHQLRQPLYLVRARAREADPWDFFTAVAELPRGEPGEGLSSADLLDRLGDGSAEAPCGGGR